MSKVTGPGWVFIIVLQVLGVLWYLDYRRNFPVTWTTTVTKSVPVTLERCYVRTPYKGTPQIYASVGKRDGTKREVFIRSERYEFTITPLPKVDDLQLVTLTSKSSDGDVEVSEKLNHSPC